MYRVTVLAVVLALAAGDAVLHRPGNITGINRFTPKGYIVGGRRTSIEEYPWQVSLQSYGFHICGGSIISKNVILTAGHCTQNYLAKQIKVRVGSSKIASEGTLHDVAEIVSHENFKTNRFGIPENDVAVLRLKTPIALGKTAEPIPLFAQSEEAEEGVMATISGWGTLEGGGAPAVLHTVNVPIITKAVCSKAYQSFGGIPKGQICAAYPQGGTDTCQGDSGGPLVIAGRQAGIVSWGNGCARKGYPGVYTEIAAVREWIVKNANL